LDVDFENVNGTLISVLDNNTEAVEFAATMAWPRIEKLMVPLPGKEGRMARARLYLPPELRKEENIEYPLVVHVYVKSNKISHETSSYVYSKIIKPKFCFHYNLFRVRNRS
jgi:hypothetical protein